MKIKDGKELAKEMADLMNNMNPDYDIDLFANQILCEHRTIQQNIGKLLLRMIVAWGDDYRLGRYDLRNEKICEISDKILKILQEEYIVFRDPTRVSLPHI